MSSTNALMRDFTALHVPGKPFVLYNVWDVGSALAVERAGAMAIATGSASVAEANGFTDGEEVPIDFAIFNSRRIVDAVNLPVSVDFESGYAPDPVAVERNVGLLVATGAVGCNFEDQIVGTDQLYSIADQAKRIAAVRKAAGAEFFINARTDIFLKASMDSHDATMVQNALERAKAYADEGASGFFVPLLGDLKLLEQMCRSSPLPINFMTYPGCPSNQELGNVGVARISHGPFPHRGLMKQLEDAARRAIEGIG